MTPCRSLFARALLLASLVAVCWASPQTAAAAPSPAAGAFPAAALDEVIALVRDRHLRPLLDRPRPWVAAANGALSLLRPAALIVTRRQLDAFAAGWPGLLGATQTLPCGGPPREDVVLFRRTTPAWHPPWRAEVAPLLRSGLQQRDLASELIGGFEAPLEEADLRCVLSVAASLLPPARHDELRRAAATWLLRAHDAHSRLMSAETWRDINDATSTHAELGMQLRRQDGRWRVQSVEAEGAAAAAGLRVDDVLIEVDGVAVTALDQAALALRLDRPIGTAIAMRVQRAGSADLHLQLVVRAVKLRDVEGGPLPPALAGRSLRGALRVRIEKFAPGGAERLMALLRPPRLAPPTALLLDLRGNQGGVLPVALEMLGHLIGAANVGGVETRDGVAEIPTTVPTKPAEGAPLLKLRPRLPIVALIDGRCASACELLAAVLRRHAGALLVGARSYGKSTLQDAIALKAGAGRVALTIGRFDGGVGEPIQARGVAPDVVLAGVRGGGPREEDAAFVLPPSAAADVPVQRPGVTADPATAASAPPALGAATAVSAKLRACGEGQQAPPPASAKAPANAAAGADAAALAAAAGWLRCLAAQASER